MRWDYQLPYHRLIMTAADMKMKSSWAQRIVTEGAQQLYDLVIL